MTRPDADAIVIGGGPAGVAAAIAMRRQGVERVILLDREQTLGGATRHCGHSPFGMLEFGRIYIGAAYGRKLESAALQAGIDVRPGHSVVDLGADGRLTVSNAQGVESLSARRILVTTGAREAPRSARLLPGDRPLGIVTTGTLQSYVAFHGLMPFRRPVILGSELVSQSALLTCLTHGARPVAMVETTPHPLARAPFNWLPRLAGVPFYPGARVVDIIGRQRVEAIRIVQKDGNEMVLECDGLLLTGQFTPEAALVRNAGMALDTGTGGPAVDQDGRCANPLYFAAGNVLRPIETGGWAFREGRAIGTAIARDLLQQPVETTPITVLHDDPVKLVVPNLLRKGGAPHNALSSFQLRFKRRARGCLMLEVDGRTVFERSGLWTPERRVLVPMPAGVTEANHVHFRFREES